MSSPKCLKFFSLSKAFLFAFWKARTVRTPIRKLLLKYNVFLFCQSFEAHGLRSRRMTCVFMSVSEASTLASSESKDALAPIARCSHLLVSVTLDDLAAILQCRSLFPSRLPLRSWRYSSFSVRVPPAFFCPLLLSKLHTKRTLLSERLPKISTHYRTGCSTSAPKHFQPRF